MSLKNKTKVSLTKTKISHNKPFVTKPLNKEHADLYKAVVNSMSAFEYKGLLKEFKERVHKAHRQGMNFEKMLNISQKYVTLI